MKTLLGFILGLCFMGLILCSSQYNPSNPNNIQKVYADEYNFSKFNGKTIQSIQFIEYPHTVPGSHDVLIRFTDGTELRMFIYKYKPQIKL
jgi:hypothetical protein